VQDAEFKHQYCQKEKKERKESLDWELGSGFEQSVGHTKELAGIL
jgi:hypothetical protein